VTTHTPHRSLAATLAPTLAAPTPEPFSAQLTERLGADPKVLVIDIETSPNLAHVWGLWDQNIGLSQLHEVGEVISFASKWYGKAPVEFRSNYHDGHEVMVERAWDLMNEADAIVHFNGVTFDMKHLHKEFLLNGLTPPSPHKDIDLLRVVKSRFRFASNKLQFVSTALGLGGKVQHQGHELWVRCLLGEASAWEEMKLYNIQDTVLTEQVYDHVRPWIKGHPALTTLTADDELLCTNCGSADLLPDGTYTAAKLIYPQLQCQHCGAWFRGNKAIGRAAAVHGV
jgi:hypothetical protein